MSNIDTCYMEKDGAVKIPEKYKKMSHEEITAECARLVELGKAKVTVKKPKVSRKTKFVI